MSGTTGRGAQVVFTNTSAQRASRGGYGRTMQENMARKASLEADGTASDGSTVDGSTLSGLHAEDVIYGRYYGDDQWMNGPLTMLADPVNPMHVATKQYVDNRVGAGVAGVAAFNTRIGMVTLLSADVTSALGFTPYNATNPANYTSQSYVDAAVAATARNKARLQAQWVTSAIVANDTVWLAYDAPYAGTINALTYFTGNGSFSVAIQINGTNVTGLSAISVSSATPATATATAANTFTAGQRITAVITSATSSPTDALLSLAVTWS